MAFETREPVDRVHLGVLALLGLAGLLFSLQAVVQFTQGEELVRLVATSGPVLAEGKSLGERVTDFLWLRDFYVPIGALVIGGVLARRLYAKALSRRALVGVCLIIWFLRSRLYEVQALTGPAGETSLLALAQLATLVLITGLAWHDGWRIAQGRISADPRRTFALVLLFVFASHLRQGG